MAGAGPESRRAAGACLAAAGAAVVLAPAAPAPAAGATDAVFSPRIVGEHRADFYSLETLLASPPFAGRTGEDLALAIYDYFTSTVNGTWHGWPMNEREGDPVAWGDVSDPVRTLNAYGWHICGQAAEMLYGLYRAAGMPSRLRGLPGHVVCEVFFGDRWHVLDVDMWTWFRMPGGHIAGVDELAENARTLIVDNTAKSSPCNLPDRTLDDYARMYDGAKASVFPAWATRAHTMDFRLRPGEMLVRSQEHAGRFHLPQSWQDHLAGRHKAEWQGVPRDAAPQAAREPAGDQR
jgi:hypothetical protein